MMWKRPIILTIAALVLALGPSCGRQGLSTVEVWSDDEGREIGVSRGEVWTGHWVEPQTCAETGQARPRERFRLLVDEEGYGVGTIGICRWGFSSCANGPATAVFEATVSVDRIEGTVLDRDCNSYEGTEILRRVRCRARTPSDYVASSVPLDWREDSSRIESGILAYRATLPDRSPGGEIEAWALSPVRGALTLLAPTGFRVVASDGELHYGFAEGGETLGALGNQVYVGTRLARLPVVPSESGGSLFELTLLGFTPALNRTDPHCVRGESGSVMARR